MAAKLVVTGLNHDLGTRKSYVTFIWSDEPGKRLGLEVPYGTALDDVAAAARTARSTSSAPWRGTVPITSRRDGFSTSIMPERYKRRAEALGSP